jgi:hypothetical protein
MSASVTCFLTLSEAEFDDVRVKLKESKLDLCLRHCIRNSLTPQS